MIIQRKWLSAVGALGAAMLLSGTVCADTAIPGSEPGSEPGSWQPHQFTFNFMGFTTTYSCEGLEDKLKLLLKMSGASPDMKVIAPCDRGSGRPDRLAMAYLTFSTLQPGAASNAADGTWRHVAVAPRHPYQFELGDCELIEQFRDKVLPMFAIRNLTNSVTCVPHQDSGSNFNLSYDVFAPPPVAKKPS